MKMNEKCNYNFTKILIFFKSKKLHIIMYDFKHRSYRARCSKVFGCDDDVFSKLRESKIFIVHNFLQK